MMPLERIDRAFQRGVAHFCAASPGGDIAITVSPYIPPEKNTCDVYA